MQGWLTSRPVFVLLMAIGAMAMLVPAVHALALGDYRTARIFLYGAILSAFLTGLIGLATTGYAPRSIPRSHLTTLLAAFGLLPLMLAVPFYEAAGQTTVADAWFEMVSAMTGTGASLYDPPGRLNPSLHLWRSLVGWLGGMLVWIMAAAVLAPMNLGGFEVRAVARPGDATAQYAHLQRPGAAADRLLRVAGILAPIYMALTAALWTLLVITGEAPFVALCHAMGTLSTSGISPVGGVQGGTGGMAAEMVLALFLLLALTRLWFSRGLDRVGWRALWQDPELRLGLGIIAVVAGVMTLRQLAAAGQGEQTLGAIFGTIFTALSYLTTTGYLSQSWPAAVGGPEFGTPGLILLGLAVLGGGVATTAGGVKLLRLHALLRHGLRELERIVHPDSVGGSGLAARRLRRQGAVMAWVFFILFALSLAAAMLALSLTGLGFEQSMVLAVAALTTTGPLATTAGSVPFSFAVIPDLAQFILAIVMVLGRLETLALIALFNPDFWRS